MMNWNRAFSIGMSLLLLLLAGWLAIDSPTPTKANAPMNKLCRHLYLPVLMEMGQAAPLESSTATPDNCNISADFNGDGYADLVIGAPEETIDGFANTGLVHIAYGTREGLSAEDEQVWALNDVPILGLQSGARYGSALAIGDFNRDGFDDLAVGVPRFDSIGQDTGMVHILHGSVSGLQNEGIWLETNITGNDGNIEADDRLGEALTVGDFNGDGYADLVIGVPGEDLTGLDNGAVYIIFGSAIGLTSQNYVRLDQALPDVSDEHGQFDQFGTAVAAGNLNGDPFDDLLVGVPGETIDAVDGVGAVHLFTGQDNGLTETHFLYQGATLGASHIPGTPEANDHFGAVLAIGDFTGDRVDDLAIGVPEDNRPFVSPNPALQDSGSVYVLHGSSTETLAIAPTTVWSQALLTGTRAANDRFGNSLTIGDFNGDGYADLAIGVAGEEIQLSDEDSISAAGAVNVVYSAGDGSGLVATGDLLLNQQLAEISGQPENNDQFGQSLSNVDLNGDGYSDLVIGVPHDRAGGVADAGGLHVIYGTGNGLDLATEEHWSQVQLGGSLQLPEANDLFGSRLP